MATKPVIILINLVVIHLLLIGVLITGHVTVTVVLTELGNLVTLAAAVQAALQAALTPEGEAWHAVIQAESFRAMVAVGPEAFGITNV